MDTVIGILTVAALIALLWSGCQVFVALVWFAIDTIAPVVKGLKAKASAFYCRKIALKKPYSLPIRGFTGGQVLYTWEDWRRDNRKEYPIRYFLTETLPIFWGGRVIRPIADAWYFVKTRTVTRYHVLDLRNPEYSGGWIDRSEVILYASFNALKDFMEGEEPWKTIDWESDDAHSEAWFEINALYHWWTDGRWQDRDRLEKLQSRIRMGEGDNCLEDLDKEASQLAWDFEEELRNRDDEMLRRLINVRHYLWT